MSDFFDSMVEGTPNISVKVLKKIKSISNPILFSKNFTKEGITLIVDEILNSVELKMLQVFLEKLRINDYQIIYPLKVNGSDENDKTAIYKKFISYKIDLAKYIPTNSKVISFGRALFSITESNDLDCSKVVDDDSDADDKDMDSNSIIQGFYDTILWKTSFFDNKTKSWIYPVDGWRSLISKRGGFAENFEVWFFKKQLLLIKDKIIKPYKIKKLNLIKVNNPNQWLMERINDKVEIAIDTETKGLDPFSKNGKIVCVTISYDGYTGYYLKWEDIDTNILSNYLKDRPLILTNGKYDVKWLHLKGNIPLENMKIFSDTVLLQQICNEMMRKGLKAGAFLYTPYGGYDKELDDYVEKHKEINDDYSLIPEEVLFPYATTDPCITYLVHKELLKYRDTLDSLLNSNNKYGYSLKYCYNEIIIPALNNFVEVEIMGMDIDLQVLKETSENLQKDIIKMQEEIKLELGNINVNSNDELGIALEKKGLPIIDRNIKGLPNVGESQLKAWKKEGYEIANTILKYREISKNFSTFVGMENVENFGQCVNNSGFDFFESVEEKKKKKKGKTGIYQYIRDDNKVHGSFAIFSTQSLRSRSYAMNLQQIPSHGEKAKIARSFFRPPTKNHAFLSTDLSGIQLRIGAILSGDPVMRDVFISKGGNLHLMTAMSYIPFFLPEVSSFEKAEKILKENGKEKDLLKDFRFKAKSINFLCEFGGSASVLAEQSILTDWTEEFMDLYIEKNGLKEKYEELLLKSLEGSFYFVKPELSKHNKILYTKAFIVAENIIDKFFTTYKGLKKWINVTKKLAEEQGYIVNVHGTIRRLPYLMASSESGDIDKRKYKNLQNISLNTQAQCCESIIIQRGMNNAIAEAKKEGIWGKGHCYKMGMIHDASEDIVNLENEEYKKYVKIIHKWFCKDYPEYEGIPVECESNISPTYITGELWDMGTEVNPKSIDNYNII